MIQTIRDAEVKVWSLQKDVTYLKTLINELSNRVYALENVPKDEQVQSAPIDSYVSADGSEVSHKLFHNFLAKVKFVALEVTDKIKTKFLEVTDMITANVIDAMDVRSFKHTVYKPGEKGHIWVLDAVTNPSGYADLRIKDPNDAEFIRYVKLDTSGFYPYASYNTHLLPAGDSAFWIGKSDRKWNMIFGNYIYAYQYNTTAGYSGWTGIDNVVQSLTQSSMTLNYKDHSGANQSTPIVTSLIIVNHPGIRFEGGIRV